MPRQERTVTNDLDIEGRQRRPSAESPTSDIITAGHCSCSEADPLQSLLAYSARRGRRPSIKRDGCNEDYLAQDLPFACYPSKPGIVYRAGVETGGRRCPRCPDFIAVTGRVVRLHRPERGWWWVHERGYSKITIDLRISG
jgi:hypothetical protein